MAVSEAYIKKLARAARIKTASQDAADEITDLINECRKDLKGLGVLESKVADESDSLILGAVRCFVRWKLAPDANEAAENREDYMQLRDELRKRREYIEDA